MDIFYISVCFVAFLICPAFGEDPLVVEFQNATKIDVMDGAQMVHFQCHLNRGPIFVINTKVQMVHYNPVTEKESFITSSGNLEEGMPEFYNVLIKADPDTPDGMIVDFTIKTVRHQDDGIYYCRVVSDGQQFQAEREIVVHRPLDALHLLFNDLAPIAETPSDAVQIDPGMYTVACVAKGSNPATKNVRLALEPNLNGDMITVKDPVSKLMSQTERIYETTVNGTVNIMVLKDEPVQQIVCQATDSSGSSKIVMLSLSVNKYDPKVHCNKSEAYKGQTDCVLTCTVDHTGIDVESYRFQIASSNDVYNTESSHPNINFKVEDEADGISVVTFHLQKMEEDYLKNGFFILMDIKGGHTSKADVSFHEIDVPESEKKKTENNGNTETNNETTNNEGGEAGFGDNGAMKTSVTCLWALMCLLQLFL